MIPSVRRRWPALAHRLAWLALRPHRTSELVQRSYDRIAAGYDDAWTRHMRDLSLAMLARLAPPPGARCLDLTCGTGLVTSQLAARTGTRAIGVDASSGMIAAARGRHGHACDFVRADALKHLAGLPRASLDVITCAWGLGYSRPTAVVRAAARALAPGGRLGIIDNSLFSLAGVLWVSMLVFAEQPEALDHVMRVRFLPHSGVLAGIMRAGGLQVRASGDGARTYRVPDGRAAIERLTSTGAAAGFEFACAEDQRERVFARFAELLDERSGEAGVAVTHRYLWAVARKPGGA